MLCWVRSRVPDALQDWPLSQHYGPLVLEARRSCESDPASAWMTTVLWNSAGGGEGPKTNVSWVGEEEAFFIYGLGRPLCTTMTGSVRLLDCSSSMKAHKEQSMGGCNVKKVSGSLSQVLPETLVVQLGSHFYRLVLSSQSTLLTNIHRLCWSLGGIGSSQHFLPASLFLKLLFLSYMFSWFKWQVYVFKLGIYLCQDHKFRDGVTQSTDE